MTDAPTPGWYADPSNPAIEHYWDGGRYTSTRPRAGAAPVQQGPAYGGPQQYVAPAQQQYGAGPQHYAAAQYSTAGPGGMQAYGGPVSPKSRTVATILGFFFGWLGVDRFYLGNIGMGVAKLLVGWLTLGIWPLIDWIVILAGGAHDGEGLPVRNWQ